MDSQRAPCHAASTAKLWYCYTIGSAPHCINKIRAGRAFPGGAEDAGLHLLHTHTKKPLSNNLTCRISALLFDPVHPISLFKRVSVRKDRRVIFYTFKCRFCTVEPAKTVPIFVSKHPRKISANGV